jgi:trehalose-6-phosphate synthase
MKTQKENDGFKDDGKYAVWGTQAPMPHSLDGVLLVTNNKREAIAHAKEAARQGWTVSAKENKYSGYSEAVLWTNRE